MMNWEKVLKDVAQTIYESLEQQSTPKKSKKKKTENEPDSFAIAFTANKNGDAQVYVNWPKDLDPEYTANIMTKMLVLATNGSIRSSLAAAISKKGELDNNPEIADKIISDWAGVLQEEDDNKICVDPTNVFTRIENEAIDGT